MDAQAKEQFRWKFYRLAVELNIIILLVGVSALLFLLLPPGLESYRLPVVAVMLLAAVIFIWDFRKRYHATKAWLHEQPDTSKSEDT